MDTKKAAALGSKLLSFQPSESVALDTATPLALAGSLLAGKLSPNVRRVLTAYVLGHTAYKVGHKWYRKRKDSEKYVVSIRENDRIFYDVQDWLLDLIPQEKRKSLSAESRAIYGSYRSKYLDDDDYIDEADRNGYTYALWLSYDGSMDQWVTIDGHRIRVGSASEDVEGDGDEDDGGRKAMMMRMEREKRITFTASSPVGRDAVVAFLEKITEAVYGQERRPSFYIPASWGNDWHRRRDLPSRDTNTVILPGDQMQRIIDDLDEFRSAERTYSALGLPYHRGYLLYGPPGTGKTSVARAVASNFKMDVYYLPLSDLKSDNQLMALVAGVQPGSMLLLEDIDVLKAAQDRELDPTAGDRQEKVSLSGLLNALDGLATPHGLVVFMTTNHESHLDPALIREGRVDMREFIGPLVDEQVENLWKLAFRRELPETPPIPHGAELTSSQIVGVFKANMYDSDRAHGEMVELIESAAP